MLTEPRVPIRLKKAFSFEFEFEFESWAADADPAAVAVLLPPLPIMTVRGVRWKKSAFYC